jgi:hypothetical protein
MSLSKETKEIMVVALANKKAAEELSSAVDAASAASTQTAAQSAITSSNLVGVDGTGSNAAPLAGTETRLDAIESKINALIAAMKASGQMAS